jgi:prepilin-type processing-associated H-X9-DG protein
MPVGILADHGGGWKGNVWYFDGKRSGKKWSSASRVEN